jgi:hypothetical protein
MAFFWRKSTDLFTDGLNDFGNLLPDVSEEDMFDGTSVDSAACITLPVPVADQMTAVGDIVMVYAHVCTHCIVQFLTRASRGSLVLQVQTDSMRIPTSYVLCYADGVYKEVGERIEYLLCRMEEFMSMGLGEDLFQRLASDDLSHGQRVSQFIHGLEWSTFIGKETKGSHRMYYLPQTAKRLDAKYQVSDCTSMGMSQVAGLGRSQSGDVPKVSRHYLFYSSCMLLAILFCAVLHQRH